MNKAIIFHQQLMTVMSFINILFALINLLMNKRVDQFQAQFPGKILEKADKYSKTLHNFYQLPTAKNKLLDVVKKAQTHKNEIDYTIQESHYQQQLFRRKEEQDLNTRTQFEDKLKKSFAKNAVNNKQIDKKKAKDAKQYDRHLKEVYKKYDQQQKNQRKQEKEQSIKLRTQLNQFYTNQSQRKKTAQFKQTHVEGCYQDAINRLNQIHKKSQDHSFKTEESLHFQLKRNGHYDSIINNRRRSLSQSNKRKQITYQRSIQLFNNRQNHFIQKYGNNQQGSLNAFRHIQQECDKKIKKLQQTSKFKTQKTTSQKKRLDQQKQQISQRCSTLLQNTNKASFRQTASTFRQSAKQWLNIVKKMKKQIKQADEAAKDKIMNIHLDLRLKNNTNSKINEKMTSMRLHTKKLANDYL